jgi:23S rRNA maturation-related 3'-5' exoribonuclease YhaM
MNYTIDQLLSLDENKYDAVSVIAILDTIENGGLTSTGKPYVKGWLSDRQFKISFKLWGYTLEELRKDIKKPFDVCSLISCRGSLQVAPNGQLDLIIGYDNGNPAIRVLTKSSVLPYIYSQPYEEEELYSQIESCVSAMKDSSLKIVCGKVLETYGEKMRYYPYSTLVHKERGGAMYHIVRCLQQIPKEDSPISVGTNQVFVNYDMLKAAIICHRLGIYDRYKVNQPTGRIMDTGEVSKVLYRQMDNYTAFIRLVGDAEDSELRFLQHMVLLVNMPNGTMNPACLEAQIFADIVRNELRTYSFAEMNDMESNSVSPVVATLGHKIVVAP